MFLQINSGHKIKKKKNVRDSKDEGVNAAAGQNSMLVLESSNNVQSEVKDSQKNVDMAEPIEDSESAQNYRVN